MDVISHTQKISKNNPWPSIKGHFQELLLILKLINGHPRSIDTF